MTERSPPQRCATGRVEAFLIVFTRKRKETCGADPRFRFISLRRGWVPDRQTRPRCWFVPFGSTFVSAFGMADSPFGFLHL